MKSAFSQTGPAMRTSLFSPFISSKQALGQSLHVPLAAGKRPCEGNGEPQMEEHVFLPSCLKK